MTKVLTLRDYFGDFVAHYLVEEVKTEAQPSQAAPEVSHHILILDRSGSMYYDIANLRSMTEKLLTVAEFNSPNQLVSLISYSSAGDVKLHFARVTVADVMAPGSKYLGEIRSLQATGLTCISQAIALANSVIQDNETTCISLHSDGFANHMSPGAEKRAIDGAVASLKTRPRLFVNTVAYSNYCDFPMLDGIAQALAGKCVRATSISNVYEALYDTQKMLSRGAAPVVEIKAEGADLVLAISVKDMKTLSSNGDLKLLGLSSSANPVAYRLRKVDGVQKGTEEVHPRVRLAFARTLLASGDIEGAKFVLSGSKETSGLLRKHARALTSVDLASFADALDHVVYADTLPPGTASDSYGLGVSGISIPDLCLILQGFPKGFLVHMPTLTANYRRRGVKRIAGTRDAAGVVTPPKAKLKTASIEWQAPQALELNNSEATINMRFGIRSDVIDLGTGEVMREIAGVMLDEVYSYRQYTIVGDGEVTVPSLRVRITDKALHAQLVAVGLDLGTFDPTKERDLDLASMPVVNFGTQFRALPNTLFSRLATLTAAKKAVDAIRKAARALGEGTPYSADQIRALSEYHLTAALNFSAPTTTPYADLNKAIEAGEVDYRTAYRIAIGSTDVLHLGDLYSGNEYLERRFTVTVGGAEVKEPTWEHYLDPKAKWGLKTLSARTKLNAVDEIMFPVFAAILGLGDASALAGTGIAAPITAENVEHVSQNLESMLETLYSHWVRPIAFFVGASGTIPKSLGATALTPDEFKAKYGTKPGKKESDGTFFVLNGGQTIIVYPEAKLVSLKVEKDLGDDE